MKFDQFKIEPSDQSTDIIKKARELHKVVATPKSDWDTARVAASVPDYLQPIVWLLGTDVVKHIGIDGIQHLGFPFYVCFTLQLLHKSDAETVQAYHNRILKDPDAVRVKLAVLHDQIMHPPKTKTNSERVQALTRLLHCYGAIQFFNGAK